jgi:hypothetical protein
MLATPQTMTWMLFTLWFIVYWILGGVFFAIVAATRAMHMRKARFSCVFTGGSIAAAYGAAVVGVLLAANQRGTQCAKPSAEAFRALGDILTCNISAVLVAGGMFFALLLTAGMVAMLFSRVDKVR